MLRAYYNEFDPKTAVWLRELIKAGLIADGEVDERSIVDVEANDLKGFTQCHFFAGIGGWSYALRLAGVADDFPVWTASLPCQPFSTAGKQLGKDDERHLLPHYIELVKQCRPATQFGEQVASAIKYGWACDLQAAMEAEGYSVGYHVLGAHSVGAFHHRQRLYWVANNNSEGLEKREKQLARQELKAIERGGDACGLGYANSDGRKSGSETTKVTRHRNTSDSAGWSNPDWIECMDNKLRPIKPGIEPLANGIPARVVRLRGYGNAIVPQVAAEFISAFMDITC